MNPESVPELPANPMSLGARMANIFSAPGEVFDSLIKSRFSVVNWLVPAVLVALIGVLCQLAVFSQPGILQQIQELQDRAIQQQVDQGKLPAEQAKVAREAMRGEMVQTIMRVAAAVGAVGYAAVAPLWWAFLMWLTGRVVFKAPFAYGRALEMTGLASLVSILGGVVGTFLAVGLGSLTVGPHLGALLKDLDLLNRVHLAMCTINVFGLWHLALLALGLARVTGRSWSSSLLVMAGIWVGFKGLAVAVGLGQWVV